LNNLLLIGNAGNNSAATDNATGLLTIQNGGTLQGNGNVIRIGNQRGAVGKLILEQDGELKSAGDIYVGFDYNANGVLDVRGGLLALANSDLAKGNLIVNYKAFGNQDGQIGGGVLTVSGGGVVANGILFGGEKANTENKTVAAGVVAAFRQSGGVVYVGANGINVGGTGAAVYNNLKPEVTLSGGTLATLASWSSTLRMTLASDMTFAPTDALSIILDGELAGDGGLVKNGNGTLLLNAANSYAGDTVVSAGTLALGDVAALGGVADLLIVSDAGAAVELSYSGTATVDRLWLDNVTVSALNIGQGYSAADLNIALGATIFSGGGLLAVSTIPEPSALALMVTGAALLALLRLRKSTLQSPPVMKKLLLFALVIPALTVSALEDWELGPFVRPANARPVIKPNPDSMFNCPVRGEPVAWESRHTFNPAAVVRNGKIYVLYRAEDDHGRNSIGSYTSRLGLAESADGVNFKTLPEPVFYPDKDAQLRWEWEGGCEDPRVVELEDGTYMLFYTMYRREQRGRHVMVGLARSRDLLKWEKMGPLFAYDDKYRLAYPSKSASLVCAVQNGRLIAKKINGRYWLYQGEGSICVYSTEDFVNWQKHNTLLHPRAGKFDSNFPESGPPAVLTDKGIILLYNGKNADNDKTDPSLPPKVYAAGQALFDANDPTKLLARSEEPFFKPEMDWEKSGQYKDGTTFIEGLVLFKNQWFLYYGCADTFVGVAIAKVKPGEM
ncbi:MAG: autotransporter-associated beta strand repeat-containing protein, partial [Verrucomicrobiales bacterium]|nr:autotransporter-associated beta strand repeat-containing protein [Verrucomicrobiales bacterium]